MQVLRPVSVLAVFVFLGLMLGVIIEAVREAGNRNTCIQNLQFIANAKNTWAQLNHAPNGAMPTAEELAQALKTGQPEDPDGVARAMSPQEQLPQGYLPGWPTCPDGGAYTIGPIGQPPTCSLGDSAGHKL